MEQVPIREILNFDELNRLVGYTRSEPFEDYFAPMKISDKQKRQRIDLAKDLDDIFEDLFIYMFEMARYGYSDYTDAYALAYSKYMEVIGNHVTPTDELILHGDELITSVLEVLYRHYDDPYYFSRDRARLIAEDDSNYVFEYDEFEDAKVNGFHMKTWNTIMDGHERDSHAEVNGMTIPIDEPFELQGGYVMFPGDDSMDADSSELAGCRCSLSYS